jgi:hypothetical protein
MVDPIDDIARQARQGSVSAIIQVLNDRLTDIGVRTRAMLSNGVLQLLCEANTPEQLEQSSLVERVRHILESIQPRNIRHININSRIVREQQLLWLEEITRDPENQLLWSQQITLAHPNPLKRWLEDWQYNRSQANQAAISSSSTAKKNKHQQQFLRGIIGGASFSLLLLLVVWGVSDWLGLELGSKIQALTTQTVGEEPAIAPSPSEAAPNSPGATSETPEPTTPDPFAQAVNIAQQAVIDGQEASSPADWLDLATRWQRAADLMAVVEADDPRYATAQDRTQMYQQNSETALNMAQQLRESQPTEADTSEAVNP